MGEMICGCILLTAMNTTLASRVLVYELVLWILANAHNIIIITTWCTNSEYYVSII